VSDPSQLHCLIRKEWVAALPEEHVRQRLLRYMIDELQFPASLIAVEQPLRQLPHLSVTDSRRVPDRRADILCFAKSNNETLIPLLLIECKAVKLSGSVINQVLGYNHFAGCRFIALVNQEEIRTGWYDVNKGEYDFIDFLPSYPSLLASLDQRSSSDSRM
jgi:hypothetical protein